MADQLTAAGLEIDDLEDRIASLIGELRSKISVNLDASTDTPEGQFIRIFAERAQSLAELIQSVHASQYPDEAIGNQLSELARLTGTFRRSATPSVVTATVNVDAGTYVAGTLIAHVSGDPTARFENAADVVNAGPGAADVAAVFNSQETGPVRAYSGTLTVIAEPVTGWNSITNAADAVLGSAEETDSQLRSRRQDELITGSTSVDAIRTALSQTTGVVWVSVLENDGDDYDDEGLPPHSISPIVHAPTADDDDIAQVIFDYKPAGIASVGSTTVNVLDSSGNYHSIGFQDASVVNIYLEIDVNVIAEEYDGDTEVKEVVASYGDDNFGVGDSISIPKIIHAIIDNINGIDDITEIRVGIAPSPTQTTTYYLSHTQIGDLDTARIVVTSTEV